MELMEILREMGALKTRSSEYIGMDIKLAAKEVGIEHPEETVKYTLRILDQIKSELFVSITDILNHDDEEALLIQENWNYVEKPYQWWLNEDGNISNRAAFAYEDIIRFGPALNDIDGKPSLDNKVLRSVVHKKILMDLLHLQIIINHWQHVFRNWGHDTSLEILYQNIFEKISYWLWKESGVCHLNIPPWSKKGSFEEEPNHQLLCQMDLNTRDRVLKSLDRNIWLWYLPIQEVMRHFGYERLLSPKVEVHSHKLGNTLYGHEDTRNRILLLLKDPLHMLSVASSLNLNTTSTKKYLKSMYGNGMIECTAADLEFTKDNLFYLPVPRNAPNVGRTPISGPTLGLVKPNKIKPVNGLKELPVQTEDPEIDLDNKLIKKTENFLDLLAADDEVGVLQKHVFYFLGQTKPSKEKVPVKRKATYIDVVTGLATNENSEITTNKYLREAKRANDVINSLFKKYHGAAKPPSSHPVYQEFVLLFPEGMRVQKKGSNHWTFSGGKNQTGIDSEPIAKWLVKHFEEAVKIAIKRLEKLKNK